MGSLLEQYSKEIEGFLETLRPLIDFDFSVVDENTLRIIGTGYFERYVGLTLPEGTATYYVVKTGKPLILDNPLDHEVCQNCPTRRICLKDNSIIYPINLNGKTIGAVTIGAVTNEQKTKQKQMLPTLELFLEQLTKFIAGKVQKHTMYQRIETALEHLDYGMMITNSSGEVLFVNRWMNQFLDQEIQLGALITSFFPTIETPPMFNDQSPFNYKKVKMNRFYGDKELLFSIKPIQTEHMESEFLYIFKEVENHYSENQLVIIDDDPFDQIKGSSKAIKNTKSLAFKASTIDSNVLIQGESGTGKELFARYIHRSSARCDGPFVAINCAAIPETLMESELFGYEPGAFTGANKGGKAGKFELAHNGTLFLDEIGDLAIHLQPKLLRAIEYGHVERIGGTKPLPLNVRIIAATNKPLEQMVKKGDFRDDLFYRLSVIPLNIPSLRDRREDIISLAYFFIEEYCKRYSKKILRLSNEAEQALLLYDWPGNVRELANVIEYAIHIEQTDLIQLTSLPSKVSHSSFRSSRNDALNIKAIERRNIQELLSKHGNSLIGKQKIASELGISLSTLYRRLRKIQP